MKLSVAPLEPSPTPPTPAAAPAAIAPVADPAAPAAPTSLISAAQPAEWKEFAPDATKSAEENATAKAAHDATKPVAAAPVVPVVQPPLDFAKDIKLPEGFEVDPVLSKDFSDIINDDKLTRAERGQKFIELQAKAMTALSEGGKAAWDAVQVDWTKNVQSDPEVGGDKLPGVMNNIGRLIDQYGGPDNGRLLREVYGLTGAGNHVEQVKFLNRIAVKLLEPGPTPPPVPSNGDKTAAEVLFPTMKK